MTKKPFDEVLHIGPNSLLVTAKVEEGSPLAYRALWESGSGRTGRPRSFRCGGAQRK